MRLQMKWLNVAMAMFAGANDTQANIDDELFYH